MVTYLQLAHNERHAETGSPVAKVIHNFGRADQVDREALRRLVSSISRFLEPEATLAGTTGDVEIVDSRRFGGAYVLDALWERLGIGQALHHSATGRRLDAKVAERVLFALVANRCLEPSSKLAAVRWATERVALPDCPDFDDDAAYAAMDFLLEAIDEIASQIFTTTANLLNLTCDVIFVDTSSTYFASTPPTSWPSSTWHWVSGRRPRSGRRAACPRKSPRGGSPSTQRTIAPTAPRSSWAWR